MLNDRQPCAREEEEHRQDLGLRMVITLIIVRSYLQPDYVIIIVCAFFFLTFCYPAGFPMLRGPPVSQCAAGKGREEEQTKKPRLSGFGTEADS